MNQSKKQKRWAVPLCIPSESLVAAIKQAAEQSDCRSVSAWVHTTLAHAAAQQTSQPVGEDWLPRRPGRQVHNRDK